jgi:hypothetical protein
MIMFCEFIEKKYPIKKYPTEKSAEEQIKKPRGRKVEKTTQRMRRLEGLKGEILLSSVNDFMHNFENKYSDFPT